MKLLLLILTAILTLSSCYTQNKAERQIIKAQTHHPASVASLCANMYPPLEFTKDSFIYLPGRELPPRIDTVTANCDSLIAAGVTVVRIPCPPCKQKAPDTMAIVRHTQVANKAEIQKLNYQINDLKEALSGKDSKIAVLQDDNGELKKAKNKFMWCLIILSAYTVFRIVSRFIPALAWLRPFLI